MKDCENLQNFNTCQHRVSNFDGTKMMCGIRLPGCQYKSRHIKFVDVPMDAIMFKGNIESAWHFMTKAELMQEINDDDWLDPESEWQTASVQCAQADLADIIEDLSQEMHEDWGNAVDSVYSDTVVKAGIDRLNEILSKHPTYFEDQIVTFESQ